MCRGGLALGRGNADASTRGKREPWADRREAPRKNIIQALDMMKRMGSALPWEVYSKRELHHHKE